MPATPATETDRIGEWVAQLQWSDVPPACLHALHASLQYNLALGMRRASAVRQYLTARGIGADRLTVSSNGEERPLCQTQGEPCWGTNRRDDVVITAGGDRIVANR